MSKGKSLFEKSQEVNKDGFRVKSKVTEEA